MFRDRARGTIVLLPEGVLHSADMADASRVLVGVDIGGTKTAVVAGRTHAQGLRVIGRRAFPTDPASRSWRAAVDMICETFLQNEANACALAEWRLGAGMGTRNMVFLTFGTGMGAGLILDGRLDEGTCDLGGEVGHVRLAEGGTEGYGKAGSFEGFCSGGGIARLARAGAERWLAAGRAVSFCPDTAALESITSKAVGDAAEAGDPLAQEVLATTGRYLGRGLALLMDILNPQRIVIGSIFIRCRRFLQPSMDAEIAREALPGAARACEVVPAKLEDSIGDYASLSVAVDGLSRRERGDLREEKR